MVIPTISCHERAVRKRWTTRLFRGSERLPIILHTVTSNYPNVLHYLLIQFHSYIFLHLVPVWYSFKFS